MSTYGFDQQVHGHTTTIGKYRGNLAGVNGSTKGLQDAKILFLFFLLHKYSMASNHLSRLELHS